MNKRIQIIQKIVDSYTPAPQQKQFEQRREVIEKSLEKVKEMFKHE